MIAAVIPTRYHPPELAKLLDVLTGDGVVPIVLESDDYGHRIYAMWNAGVAKARTLGARHIAILNDDVALPAGALGVLASVLDEHPDIGVVYPDERVPFEWLWKPTGLVEFTTGTWGAGGMTGFAFMFRADLGIPFDETFAWWYGDDAFEQAVRDADLRVARVCGVPVSHVPNRSAGRDWERIAPLVEQDRARWDRHWEARMARYYATANAGRRE